jgi:hypothetical protein
MCTPLNKTAEDHVETCEVQITEPSSPFVSQFHSVRASSQCSLHVFLLSPFNLAWSVAVVNVTGFLVIVLSSF